MENNPRKENSNSVNPLQAFELIKNDLGLRTISVGLYRIMTTQDPILVLKDPQQAQLFKIIMDQLTSNTTFSASLPDTPLDSQLVVIGEKTYKQNWKKFSGRNICFVEEERTVKNPGVDLLMEMLLENYAKAYSTQQILPTQFLDVLHEKISRITETAVQIKEVMEEIPTEDQKHPRMKKIMKQNLRSKKEKELVFHIFELLKGISLDRGNIRQLEHELDGFKSNIGKKHPLYAFFSEHEQILSLLDTLEDIPAFFSNGLTQEEEEIIRIIAENTVEEDKHYRREEEILFPRLKAKGITGTPWVLKKDHARLKSKKRKFLNYAENPEKNEEQLIDLINSLPHLLREHVFKENTILYPIVIEKLDEWDIIRQEAEKIGYCQFQPV